MSTWEGPGRRTHHYERSRIAARVAQFEDAAKMVRPFLRPLRVVRVLHVHGVAMEAEALEILEAPKHPLGVGGKRAVVIEGRHTPDVTSR